MARKKKNMKFDLESLSFVPEEETESLCIISDVETLHLYITDAIENGLTLEPIWQALDRNNLEPNGKDTCIVELLGGPYGNEQNEVPFVVKMDSSKRFCDILRKISALEYTVIVLKLMELPGVKAVFIRHLLEAAMNILEKGESLDLNGLYLSGGNLYPSHLEPSLDLQKTAVDLSLYEKMLYFVSHSSYSYLQVNLDFLRGHDLKGQQKPIADDTN